MLTRLGGMRNITMPNFFETGLSKAEILRFFDFPNGRRRYLLFLKSPNFLANGVQRIKTHEHVKFWQQRSIGCEDINIFQFFKMVGDAIFDFQSCEISLADSAWKAQTHHRAKCCQNWLSVVETLQFFEFSIWPLPPPWIFEIAKFYWLLGQRGSRHISMLNFVKIGQSVAKILNFFWFFKMAAAAILDCRIHKILLPDSVQRAETHHCIKFRQKRSFHCGDIGILQIFKMAAAAILDF